MINKIKYLFLLAICATVFGSAIKVSAQSQTDTNKLINYYEWLFETQFTGEQRSQYSEIKAEDYRADGANEKKGIDSLMANFAKIKSKDENEQARIRGNVVGNFVKSLEDAGSDNQEAVFLLGVYNDAQKQAAREAEASGAGDISAYVGKWVWAHSGSSTISTGGAYMGSNGSRFTYQFSADGTVEFTGIMNVMNGGCSQQIFRSIRGKASVSGNNLTISWQPEKFTRDFSCDTANNYTKTMPAKIEKYKVAFKTDLGQKQMCFVGAECFSPTK